MEEQLKLTLSTEFLGTEDAAKYAEALRGVAAAESKLGRASRAAAKAVTESSKAKEAAAKTLPASPAVPDAAKAPAKPETAPNYRAVRMGPFSRVKATQDAIQKAEATGADSETVKDLQYQLRLAQRLAARASNSEDGDDRNRAIGQAILSTRFNAGPFSPLLGRSLRAGARYVQAAATPENLQRLSALPGGKGIANLLSGASEASTASIIGRLVTSPAGVASAALLGLAKAAKTLYDAEFERAKKGAELTDKIAQSTAAFGSPSRAAEGQSLGNVFGVDTNSAAFSFQERIATDPLARNAASRLGIADLQSPYGSLDPGKKYMEAIKKLAREGDESLRRRPARILGVEQEVERYRMLSPETRRSFERQAEMSGQVNDKGQQKATAEFDAAQERLENAKKLFGIARQKGSLPTAIQGMNKEAEAYELATRKMGESLTKQRRDFPTADWSKAVSSEFWDRINKSSLSRSEKIALRQQLQELPSNDIEEARKIVDTKLGKKSGGEVSNEELVRSNEQLTNALLRLNKNIGETNRSREATPQNLTGSGLYDALTMGALRMSALG
jgi:hypothetical protein